MKRALSFFLLAIGLVASREFAAFNTTPARDLEDPPPPASAAPAPAETAPAQPLEVSPQQPGPSAAGAPVKFYVIPIREQIGQPTVYVVRNGVKEAISAGADFIVLNMNTPGGDVGSMFQITEMLEKFKGRTVTFVNREAVSAGAIISAATNRIYFTPLGVIGAAAPVTGQGQDIDQTMKDKVVSYLRARVRAISEDYPFRGEVVSAMIDKDFDLKIGEEMIRPKGGPLLSLTAKEAMKEYGEPPRPLLGAGIVEDLPALYRTLAGTAPFEVREFEMTWSIKLAHWLTAISPLLLGLGGLLLFIEFKTPGFGGFGVAGIVLLLIVFFGHYIAGLSGHEPVLFFLLGAALVFVEVFFFPGVIVVAMTGILLMLGALLWGMADVWPGEAFELTPDLLVRPLVNLALGAVVAVAGGAALLRYLPHGWVFDRLVVGATVGGAAQRSGGAPEAAAAIESLVGRRGVAATALRPGGQVEIEGRRYEARCEIGVVDAGAPVIVRGRTDFGVIVEKDEA